MSECKRILVTGSVLVVCLFLVTWFSRRLHESFTILAEPSVYPSDAPMLCEYPLSHNGLMEKLKNGSLSNLRPVLPSSYKQVTNNVRDWPNPENGSAEYVEINGYSIYGKKNTSNNIHSSPPNKPNLVRVGYFQAGMPFMM